ncbi:3-oxoacyl-ACP reductase [Galactobacter caseinivorans]|uniref:3-oxoacyl-ACP reductase n=1 Tax=Galactobacter caseinivorans TaxID=2676123 RepID=A0A496PKR0_9MICC|nr:3-oxoacyl-ACP reductase [Galactobacter caseinivorans]RKW71096.1 3-oxoacyl-ACP reductase [Galactobacter caseinivorans]
MADQYLDFANTPFGRSLAKRLGLPAPVRLRRYEQGAALIPGAAMVIGSSELARTTGELLLGWGLEVRTHDAGHAKLGAIVVVLDDVTTPADLSPHALTLSPALKRLAPGGRVITIARPEQDGDAPELAAARLGVTGMLRSVAHELRGGATANGIELEGSLDLSAPSAQAALRFLLSGRSAYVDGQFLRVDSQRGVLPQDADRPLVGKVAVVTGAARGIGAAIARVLRRDGATLVVVDVPQAGDALAKVANEVEGTALQLDVTRPEAGELIAAHAKERHGALDIVVHNAGITRDKLLANMDAAKWDSVIAVNIESQLAMNRAFKAAGLDQLRIVSLASTSGIAGNRGQSNYGASKAGVIGMVRASAPQLSSGVAGINAVAPGFIETEMTAKIPFATRAAGRLILPSLQQGGLPRDVAEAISFLASDSAAGINGRTLRVCGQSLIGA